MKWLIAIAASLLVLVASAIEAPKPAPGTPPPKEEAAKDEPAEKTPAAPAEEETPGDAAKAPDADAPEEAEEQLPPLPPDAVPAGPPPGRFNPTEKVRADFPVSFPIDI
jgi:hypothetical protein